MKDKPDIRFDGFNDAWEQEKLGVITESFSGGTPLAGKSEYYGGEIPFIRSGEISATSTELFITAKGLNNSSAKMVKVGDILYALYGATSGEVSISRINGAINQAILAIRPTKDDNSYLIVQWLKKQKETIISTYLQGGQGNLSGSIVKDLIITLPKDKNEQIQIGTFFKSIDNLITLHQRELENYKLLKKGFLQKLFPSNGDTNPSIRFDGFTDAWEQRRLGELGSVAMNKRIFKEETSEDGDIPFFKIGTFGGNPDSYISRKKFEEYKSKYSYPEIGDLLLSVSGSIGRIVEYKGEEAYYQDSNIVWLKHDKRLINSFLKQFYSVVKWSGLEGSTIKRLYNKNILETEIKLPTIEEQYQIGTFFQSLDNLITLHQRELDNYKELKKGFLQKMFV